MAEILALARYAEAKQMASLRAFFVERNIVLSGDSEALIRELVIACHQNDESRRPQ